MRGSRLILSALAAVAMGYGAYPFVTLHQLRTAVQAGDAATLSALIDWPAVREGIKEDICDLVLDEPADSTAKADLPPFGASFVRGVTGSAVDREITAETLVAFTRPPVSEVVATSDPKDDTRVGWAFFSSLTRFSIDVITAGEPQPVKVEMGLSGLHWKVMRVRIPANLLEQSHWHV